MSRQQKGDTGFQPVEPKSTTTATGKMPVSPSLPVVSEGTAKMAVSPFHFQPFNKQAETTKTQRNLPHWQQSGCTYFVTFRLADSLPQNQLKAWQEERDIWLKVHPQPWTNDTEDEYEKRFLDRIQGWLDAGYGSCALSQKPIQDLVAGAMQFFDGRRYRLGDFVLMPNHVHGLVTPLANFTLSSILHSWKSYTANQANRLLGRSGTFWMDENFDHIVRSEEQLRHFRQYIAQNPVTARLKAGTFFLHQGDTGFQPVNLKPTGKMPVSPSRHRHG